MRPMRSMLYIPANSPGMLQHAPIFGCDSILIDLEDAIAYTEKDSARVMASWFLREFDFKDLFVTVRLNGADTEFFEKDIETIIPCRPHAVRLPKCNSEADVLLADEKIGEAEENAAWRAALCSFTRWWRRRWALRTPSASHRPARA